MEFFGYYNRQFWQRANIFWVNFPDIITPSPFGYGLALTYCLYILGAFALIYFHQKKSLKYFFKKKMKKRTFEGKFPSKFLDNKEEQD
jgi:hypothetical protein